MPTGRRRNHPPIIPPDWRPSRYNHKKRPTSRSDPGLMKLNRWSKWNLRPGPWGLRSDSIRISNHGGQCRCLHAGCVRISGRNRERESSCEHSHLRGNGPLIRQRDDACFFAVYVALQMVSSLCHKMVLNVLKRICDKPIPSMAEIESISKSELSRL